MTELENLMFLSLGTLLNTYFSPWSLPNLSEAQTFSPANANMVLNFLKSERHILVWKALHVFVSLYEPFSLRGIFSGSLAIWISDLFCKVLIELVLPL